MKTVPEVDLDPVPRSHPRTPDIQVSNWYSSMFHNRYLLESIHKPQVQMERMSY